MKRGMFAFDANGIQVPVFSPNQVAALRLGIASLVMLPFAFISKSCPQNGQGGYESQAAPSVGIGLKNLERSICANEYPTRNSDNQ